jgi:hypothetical protein
MRAVLSSYFIAKLSKRFAKLILMWSEAELSSKCFVCCLVAPLPMP